MDTDLLHFALRYSNMIHVDLERHYLCCQARKLTLAVSGAAPAEDMLVHMSSSLHFHYANMTPVDVEHYYSENMLLHEILGEN